MLRMAVARSSSGGVANTLCTSGFVDDVMYTHYGPMACFIYSQVGIERSAQNSRDFNHVSFNNTDH